MICLIITQHPFLLTILTLYSFVLFNILSLLSVFLFPHIIMSMKSAFPKTFVAVNLSEVSYLKVNLFFTLVCDMDYLYRHHDDCEHVGCVCTSVLMYMRMHMYMSLFFYCCSITVVCIFPYPSTSPQPNPPLSPTSKLLLGFVYVSFIVVPENPSPQYPLPTPLWLLLDCS